MKKLTLINSKLPDEALFDLLNRDAALWVSTAIESSSASIDLIARLMLLPWKLVLCESSSVELVTALNTIAAEPGSLYLHRGFLHLLGVDPSSRQLPSRALPIYLLNGRDDAIDREESSSLSGMSALRRRLNMIERLQSSAPKRVIVIGPNLLPVIEQLEDLWRSDFRSLLTFVAPAGNDIEIISQHCEKLADISSISLVATSIDKFSKDVTERGIKQLPDANFVLRIRDENENIKDVDVTAAELPEQPILDNFEIIKSNNLRRLTEADLSIEDIDGFFGRQSKSWRAYAAGLPWIYDASCSRILLKSLGKALREGVDANSVLYVSSESGAGGTTLARYLAFEAASEGYPTLLVKSHVFEPDATEVVSFINRVQAITVGEKGHVDASKQISRNNEIPWLLVCDREQWDGKEVQISGFLAEITRSGRPVILLKVLGPVHSSSCPPGKEIASLTHELDRNQVISIGGHLNRFLKPFGRGKKESDWERFWEQHKPDIDTSIAAFWVTLDFWLRGLIDLGETVQSWLIKQFKQQTLSADVQTILLEISALTIERRSIPEYLLHQPTSTLRPLSVVLEEIRVDMPGLALIRQTTNDGRLWAMAHDVLGRYLLNACYHDRILMNDLGFKHIESSVELRLHLIGSITRRVEIGERRFLPYAVQFAVKTLKLDDEGNAEFYQYWREVFRILEAFPQSVRETSRTFNHHVAISRRRVAQSDMFGCTVQEKRELLQKAIEQIEFSLFRLDETYGDESNLNLYNSLALAYQDMATLELREGCSNDIVSALRAKANEATLNALRENPTNSYVLETAAKNLIQQGRLDRKVKISSAAESLGYVFQATNLENSNARQYQLGKLANEALLLLRDEGSGAEIENMKAAGEVMGFLAAAWIELTKDQSQVVKASTSEFSSERAASSLEILKTAPRHWLVVKLQYDIVCVLEPYGFEEQLGLLDELDAMGSYRLPMQLRLNRAILLHLVGRHADANLTFRNVRWDIKAQNEIVSVPENLRWLVGKDGETRLLCTARIVDDIGYRPSAQVFDLKNAQIPFTPQDFGGKKMPVGMTFKCHINFGAMGPFIKPPVSKK